jgi:hypothetical protein
MTSVRAGRDRRSKRSTIARILARSGRLLVVLALVATSAACSGGDDTAAVTETTASGDVATTSITETTAITETAAAPAPSGLPGIGDPVQDDDIVFVVASIEEPGQIYDPYDSETLADEATGKWFVVHMSVENVSDADTFVRLDASKIIWNGQEFEAPFYVKSGSGIVYPEAGELIDDVTVMFDVSTDFPEGGSGAVLELHGSPFSDGVDIGL